MKRILVSPLDWGLGHASRLVPIIRQLLADGHYILIAADNQPLAFLQKEFPELDTVRLPSYQVSYSKSGNLAVKLALQTPKIFYKIYEEHRILKRICAERQIDVVIADNRFGLYNRKVHTVFMTHQIAIQVPNDNPFLERLLFMLNKAFIRKFNEIWVPDFEGGQLTGKLTQKFKLPRPVNYIGPISRFYELEATKSSSKPNDVLVLLSGPEPQRTILEDNLVAQLSGTKHNVLLVRGLPRDIGQREIIAPNIRTLNFLTTAPLAEAIRNSKTIVCRSGYSTILDLVALKRSAILIPTPGQTEQEYLGDYLMEKGWYYSQRQDKLDILNALTASQNYQLPDTFKPLGRLPIAF